MQPHLHGVVLVEGAHCTALLNAAMSWNNRFKQAAAVCHALTFVSRTRVVGDAAEQEIFNAVEAHFVVRSSKLRICSAKFTVLQPFVASVCCIGMKWFERD